MVMNLWDVKGVPHRGWECESVIDVGEWAGTGDEIEYEQCEMCGNERIRYVHIMKHRNYPKKLGVGCVCAEKMSGDYVNPRKEENAIKNRALRRCNFLQMPWKYNPHKETYSKKYKGRYITIVHRNGKWGIYFDKYRVWKIQEQKIEDFRVAEVLAFELYEAYIQLQNQKFSAAYKISKKD